MKSEKMQVYYEKLPRDNGFCIAICHFLVYVIGAAGFVGASFVAFEITTQILDDSAHVDNRLDKMVARDMRQIRTDTGDSMFWGDVRDQRLASLLFAILYMNSSIFLICAAMKKRSDLTLPWLFCEGVMFMTQLVFYICPSLLVLPEIFAAYDHDQFLTSAVVMTLSLFLIANVIHMQRHWRKETLVALASAARSHSCRANAARAARHSHFMGRMEEVRKRLAGSWNMHHLRVAIVRVAPKGQKNAVLGLQEIRIEP